MLPRFADIFQQGNRWLNWLEKLPEGSVRPVMTESVADIGVRLENGKYPTLRLFFVRFDIDIA